MGEYICNTEDKCGVCEVYKTAEPIVRCRDCKHYQENPEGTVGCRFTLITSAAHPDGFCAWGEHNA